jgi:hypothetical protein
MKCKTCSTEVTRQEYSEVTFRLYHKGFTTRQAREMLTLCHDCLTEWFRAHLPGYAAERREKLS